MLREYRFVLQHNDGKEYERTEQLHFAPPAGSTSLWETIGGVFEAETIATARTERGFDIVLRTIGDSAIDQRSLTEDGWAKRT